MSNGSGCIDAEEMNLAFLASGRGSGKFLAVRYCRVRSA